MDASLFDRWTRIVAASASRRTGLLGLLAGVALGTGIAGESEAGPGCKNVGKPCQNDGDCCSDRCKGKKGKKTCKAHDTGGCEPGQIQSDCGGVTVLCMTSSGKPNGNCDTTTGKAGYCTGFGNCFSCTKDADCQPYCGARAACIKCAGCPGETACAGPSTCDFPPG